MTIILARGIKMVTDLSVKQQKIFSTSLYEAENSKMLLKHGCVATRGGKIIARGCNKTMLRDSTDGFIKEQCSCHAEIDVIRKICRTNYKRHKIRRIMRKTTLYISRRSNTGTSSNSAPCMKCMDIIREMNIHKIIFNMDKKHLEYNPKSFVTTHRTFGDKFYERNKNGEIMD